MMGTSGKFVGNPGHISTLKIPTSNAVLDISPEKFNWLKIAYVGRSKNDGPTFSFKLCFDPCTLQMWLVIFHYVVDSLSQLLHRWSPGGFGKIVSSGWYLEGMQRHPVITTNINVVETSTAQVII